MRFPGIILIVVVVGPLLAGCSTKAPPTRAQIQQQALTNVALPPGWKAGDAPAGAIADNWLASFDDAELDRLVADAMNHNPDLRVAAARVEQAAQYVELARAQLRPAVNLFGTGGLKMGGGDMTAPLQGI